jgi:adenosylcobinamide-GDP ribazoletransferase
MGKLIRSFLGGVAFYTVIPLSVPWELAIERVARWAPVIGLLIGGLLGLSDVALEFLGIPILTRSALIIALGVGLTGGLHLDGTLDTADGLAVPQKERRLEVMKESTVGAFGAIAGIVLLILKTAALGDIQLHRWLALMLAAGWGRWGQVLAIALYPYLRATGTGAFHKRNLRCPQDVLLGLFFLLGCSGIFLWLEPQRWWEGIIVFIGGSAIASLTGYWFYRQLEGHTGDTYGAVVEWSEAFVLCLLTGFLHH